MLKCGGFIILRMVTPILAVNMFLQKINVNGEDRFYSYDGKGNLYGGFGVLRDYNYKNLPLEMFNADSKLYKYGYNDSGERIKKTETDSVRTDYYLRDYLGRELVIYNYETNDPKQVNIYGNGLVGKIEIDTTETRSYYLKDHLGNIRCAVSNEGALLNAQDYYPYGETIRQFNNTRYMLTEKERDTESSNDYFGARYYNSKLGVWLQVDPLSEKNPNESPYTYAYCNPLRFFDPDGNNGWDFLKGVAVGFGRHMVSTVSSIAKMVSEGPTGGLNPASNLERATAIQSMIENPGQIIDAIESKFEQLTTDFGTSQSSGEVVGEILGVAAEVAVAKKVGELSSSSEAISSAVSQASKSDATTSVITRKSLGRDNATSQHIIERSGGKTISRTHKVVKNGKVIHQHQTHIGKYGSQRQFPDDWIEHETINN